ncbi:MAG: ABC transporter permease [Acidimicrobiales bacterium]
MTSFFRRDRPSDADERLTDLAGAVVTVTGRGPWRRFFRDRAAVIGALALLSMTVALSAASWLAPADPYAVDVPHKLAHFSLKHPLGTDGLGRDLLSRMLYGGRKSVLLTLAVTAIVTVIGVTLGIIAGMRGGLIDRLLGQVVDIVQSVPLVIVSMVTIALLGSGSVKLVFVLSVLGWTRYTRVVRAATLSLREREFIESCRVLGGSRLRIALRHIVPNIVRPVVVLSTLDVGRILLTVSTLSFLGFGARPPTPEWGAMLSDARNYFFVAPRLLIIPGVAIFIVALGANLFGEGLRDAFEPHVS